MYQRAPFVSSPAVKKPLKPPGWRVRSVVFAPLRAYTVEVTEDSQAAVGLEARIN